MAVSQFLARPLGRVLVIALLGTLVIAALTFNGSRLTGKDPYTLKFLVPMADKTFEGAKVTIAGEQVGQIINLGVRDGMAVVTAEIDHDHAPLPAGTKGRIRWESVLGARTLEIIPGEEGSADLRSGHLLTSNVEGAELDDLLAMLDAPTRKKLQGLVQSLDTTVDGKEKQLNESLREAGPTIQALGEVARAVGEDGPAIKKLVTQLRGVTSTVAAKDDQLARSVAQLNQLMSALAQEKDGLRSTLAKLPGTLDTATKTLSNVKSPVESARELLRDLQPATAQLPALARDLQPALADAKPAVADLTPLLEDADRLLKETPALAAGTRDLLPTADSALAQANPMVDFLRPYAPEVAGWFSNWTATFGSRNAMGNYARALITASASSVHDLLPGKILQGQDPRPAPGSLDEWNSKQLVRWDLVDANGEAIQ
ncbi:MlaD family protein [Nocardioides daejeonensis]|uniref:MlaD family protein n=1 Tax=Nocardioides daejeonensis TaxID=1046556 RepID=UPI000D748097|nr:MlaD family protein [Nocardioides daejeonensis]